jgi:hypothetical protein
MMWCVELVQIVLFDRPRKPGALGPFGTITPRTQVERGEADADITVDVTKGTLSCWA